ncbi:transcription elongation factor spt4 [Lunasporangiospora selenospora]|uniref:Transcription elongation factor SPT4 n=1 Tax=Lunasporangiospora selenospora TaxID=979761 RepID=A0A9P6G1L4_9FUNG|nr:transcription elongation factor spt4 [Lunasporangiospora selenospora]
MSSIIPPDKKQLRACLLCSLIKVPGFANQDPIKQEQFLKSGCDNCESLLGMRGVLDRVLDCTSQHFDGMIAVMQPSESWVARWQRVDKFEKGIYAVSVQGTLPEDIEEELEAKGIRYRPRDGSARD